MAAELSFRSRSREETQALGRVLGEQLVGGDVLALRGPLGAGKTTFVQGLAIGLGVAPGVAVTSPTFVLVAEYPGRVWLRHADFYRVESYARLLDAGFEDVAGPDGVLVVEWPERFPEVLPRERLELELQPLEPGTGSETERSIKLAARGARAQEILKELEKRWP
jgi:tRNA threonylcarbamoyladenosine biosynthesis protein TsaE